VSTGICNNAVLLVNVKAGEGARRSSWMEVLLLLDEEDEKKLYDGGA